MFNLHTIWNTLNHEPAVMLEIQKNSNTNIKKSRCKILFLPFPSGQYNAIISTLCGKGGKRSISVAGDGISQ